MEQLITGIHHVTAIASDAQQNINFYAGVLGLKLIKKTVNYDASGVYHFYYGDQQGRPGTILSFFPYQGLMAGRHGKGMLNTTSFSLPSGAMEFWMERLNRFGISFKQPIERFDNESVIYFEDGDGLGLELVFNDKDSRLPDSDGPVPAEHGIRGFHNVEIWEEGYERTAGLLTEQLDHRLIAEKGNRFRFAAMDSPGNYVDIICSPDSLKGLPGSGTVHHLAFSTPDAESQLAVRLKVVKRMLNPSMVLDRKYFTSIYFREPGGVLFEVATAGPGFAIDEPSSVLARELKLPPQFEQERKEIEKNLPPVVLNLERYV